MAGPAREGQIHLYVSVPAMSGYSLKLFPTTMTLKSVIEKLNKTLPAHLRSERYHLFHNDLQLLDTDRTLSEARLPDKVRAVLRFRRSFS